MIPKDGIYAVWARTGDQIYKAVLYIGTKPTFAFNNRTIEVHIFNFSGDLYDLNLEIEFKARIRDDLYFDRVDQLIKQIETDKEATLKILEI